MRLLLVLLAGLFAVLARAPRRASRIVRISRVVADLAAAEAFYVAALGFRRVARQSIDPRLLTLLGLPNGEGEEIILALGEQQVALVRLEPAGPAYPAGSRSNDRWFQHLAIVVSSMALAYRRLSAHQPEPISSDGPQRLPARSGGVVAYKFRDPDGHPLELIHFPPGQGRPLWRKAAEGPCLGIDHSAIAVADSERSRRFYRRLGFAVAYCSLNQGTAQSRLDGLPGAVVHITGLTLGSSVPGLELLRYRPPGRALPRLRLNARLTDWVTLLVPGLRYGRRLGDGRRAAVRRDPDGHIMLLVDRL